jgi:hypothetical protein
VFAERPLNLGGQRPAADAGGVRLDDAEHLIDDSGPDAGPGGGAGGGGGGGRNERVRAVVDIEHGPLRTLEQDLAPLGEGVGDLAAAIGDERQQPFPACEHAGNDLVGVERGGAGGLQAGVCPFVARWMSSRARCSSRRSAARTPTRATLSSYAGPMPRPVVPIRPSPRAFSLAASSFLW